MNEAKDSADACREQFSIMIQCIAKVSLGGVVDILPIFILTRLLQHQEEYDILMKKLQAEDDAGETKDNNEDKPDQTAREGMPVTG
jgi:hypothetical protein